MRVFNRLGQGWREFWPFALLCVLVASRWLVEGAFPQASSTMLSEALGCALAAGVGELVAVVRARRLRPWAGGTRRWWGAQVGACLVLVGPIVGQAVSGRHLGADPVTLALALVPVVVAVGVSALGLTEAGDLPGLLWPALAGLAGLLLLLPQPSLVGWRPWAGLCAVPLLVGVGASLAGARGVELRGGLLLAAVVFGAFWWNGARGESWHVSATACALDGLFAWLTLVVVRRLGARRWSAQFLLVPLLGLLEGMVFLRPVLDVRSWVGLCLLVLGGIYQLAGSGTNEGGAGVLAVGEDESRA